VKEKTPQQLSWFLSHREGAYFLSQKITDEQNTQHSTETLSQPISQNLTATEASPPAPLRMERGVITLWTLYAEGVLWARNRALKTSVTSVRSVREKCHQRERKTSPRPTQAAQ